MLRDHVSELHRTGELFTSRDNFLDEADAERFGSVELVAGQQPSHRVGPADLAREAEGRAADGVDATLDLDLAEARRRGGDANVRREHELDADREADALDGADDRLLDAAREPERIETAVGDVKRAAREDGRPLREIEAAGEVVAVCVEDTDAQLAIAVELCVREAELVPQREVERIALRSTVETHQENVPTPLDGDATSCHHSTLLHTGRGWYAGAVDEDRSLNILLVDDDEVDVITVKRAFSNARLTNQLFVARDGAEALAALRSGTWPRERRIMLLDLNMPKMNGIELLREIRSDPELKALTVIVMTTSTDERDRVEAFQLNVSGYVVKPVTFQAFVDVMVMLDKYWTLQEF